MPWSFHLRNFVLGKGLLGFLDGTVIKPADEKAIETWNPNNAKVVTWILKSVDMSLSLSLQAFTKASEMWKHLKRIYHPTNKARKFHLYTELAKFCQCDKTVQEYYSGFLALWTERDQMLLHSITSEFLPQALKLKEELHISQFLRNLRPELEPVRAALMNREASPDLDTCVQEVLREEIRLVTRHSLITDP